MLDYNNPEISRWLRQTEIPQRKALETLIEGGGKSGRTLTTIPLKETVDDFASLVY